MTADCSWVVNHRSLSETLKLYDRSWSKTLTSSATEQWVSHYVITLPCTPLNDVIVTFQTLSFTTKGGIMALALTNLRDGHWRHVRNALSPTFSGQKLKLVRLAALQFNVLMRPTFSSMFFFVIQVQKQINRCAEQLLEQLRQRHEKDEDFEAKACVIQMSSVVSCSVTRIKTYTSVPSDLQVRLRWT